MRLWSPQQLVWTVSGLCEHHKMYESNFFRLLPRLFGGFCMIFSFCITAKKKLLANTKHQFKKTNKNATIKQNTQPPPPQTPKNLHYYINGGESTTKVKQHCFSLSHSYIFKGLQITVKRYSPQLKPEFNL